jgi:hypothetical protein
MRDPKIADADPIPHVVRIRLERPSVHFSPTASGKT